MNIAFIKLTSDQEDTTELYVEVSSIKHIGMLVNGVTFVETSAGCSYVKETPVEVLDKVGKVAEYFD